MASESDRRFLIPSLMDRLAGNVENANGADLTQSVTQLRRSVRADVEKLLNTRWRCSHWPPDLTQLDDSLVNYGIPDFSGAAFGSPDHREALRVAIERAIEQYEPRFAQVHVVLLDTDRVDRTLRFRIEGDLRAYPNPEPVVFDSQVDTVSNQIRVQRSRT
jgi:type VI secretion system protein ImpF